MTVFVCADWGDWAIYVAWGLWWLDVVLSVLCCIYMPFVVMQRHNFQMKNASVTSRLLPT